jgi:hypothetical protein
MKRTTKQYFFAAVADCIAFYGSTQNAFAYGLYIHKKVIAFNVAF